MLRSYLACSHRENTVLDIQKSWNPKNAIFLFKHTPQIWKHITWQIQQSLLPASLGRELRWMISITSEGGGGLESPSESVHSCHFTQWSIPFIAARCYIWDGVFAISGEGGYYHWNQYCCPWRRTEAWLVFLVADRASNWFVRQQIMSDPTWNRSWLCFLISLVSTYASHLVRTTSTIIEDRCKATFFTAGDSS